MTINSIKELNAAIDQLKATVSIYKAAGLEPPSDLHEREVEIEAFKYRAFIKSKCETCGAWRLGNGSYLVQTGANFTPENMYGRVCHLAHSRGKICDNPIPKDPKAAINEFGYENSTKFIDAAIQAHQQIDTYGT
jgi:hypothetical protein